MTEYMLDTSAIGEIAEGKVSAKAIRASDNGFYITHIQEDELEQAGDYTPTLMEILEVVDSDSVPTHGFFIGLSRLGRANLGGGAKAIQRKLSSNNDSDGISNDLLDAIIANTAIHNEFVLVTHDSKLRQTVNSETPGTAISIPEFRSKI